MASLKIVDDILAPLDKIVLSAEGDHFFEKLAGMKMIIRRHLEIGPTEAWEYVSKWDQMDGSYYSEWEGTKKEDKYSAVIVGLQITGEQGRTGQGKIKVKIKGKLVTKYTFSNSLQKMFWYMFNRLFYYKQRRFYIENAKHKYIYGIRDELAELFNVPVQPGF